MISWWIPFVLMATVTLIVILIILLADHISQSIKYKQIEKDHKKQDQKIDKIIGDSRKKLEEFEKKCHETWEGKKE